MPHVITQSCCGDASCVFACPVNAIQPNPGSPEFISADMLYIDPRTCVDCGACVAACPVGAIKREDLLLESEAVFASINAEFHQGSDARPVQAQVPGLVQIELAPKPLRIAVVGSGPAGLYAADELLKQDGVEVTLYDRLPTPYGLVRAGVAPDHQHTKAITDLFRKVEDLPGFRYVLGVEVGTDVTHDEILEHHSAVIYATGASKDRRLGIEGEDLVGSRTATDFVAWYNGHPDQYDADFDLSGERAVVIGNGNVALDVARILASDPALLEQTDISDRALEALRRSAVNEVVVLGRRGPEHAAFTLPELIGLVRRSDIDLVVNGTLPDTPPGADFTLTRKLDLLRSLPSSNTPRDTRRRIELRFSTAPMALRGDGCVESLDLGGTEPDPGQAGQVRATGDSSELKTSLVLRSIGYRAEPMGWLPFDSKASVVPNDSGRVRGTNATYVVGWIKRGPSGFIGTNKTCSLETVNSLLADHNAGLLPVPRRWPADLGSALRRKHPHAIDLSGWRHLDALEREQGVAVGRPRVKLTSRAELLGATVDPGHSPRRRQRRRRRWPAAV